MSGRAATKNVIAGMFAVSVGDAKMPAAPGWTWHLLTDIARLESGHTPSRRHPEWWGGDVPWIGIKDARPHHGRTIYDTIENTNDEGLANSAARLLPAGTVCLSRTASVGYVLVMGREMATSQDFVNWVCSDVLAPDFLKYLFIAEKDSLLRFSKGTTHSTIYFPEVKSFHVCCPPLNEQKRIVAKLEALQARSDAAKAALDAIPPLLEKFRQSVLAVAFRGDLTKAWRAAHPDVEPASALLARIRVERRRRWVEDAAESGRAQAEAKARQAGKGWSEEDDAAVLAKELVKAGGKYVEPEPVDVEGLPELPEGWCWARWEEVGFCQNGRAFPSKHYSASGTRLLRPGNLHVSGDLLWSEKNTRYMPTEWAAEHSSYIIGSNELVMNLTAQSLKDEFLGRVCLTGGGERCLLNQRIARLTPVELAPRFCLWLFKSRVFRRYVDDGLNSGSLIQHMFTSQVFDFVFPLPPAAEHRALVETVEKMFGFKRSVIEAAEIAEASMPKLNQSILAKAFRGELVPQDPNDEPASVLLERIRAEREANSAKPKRRRQGRRAAG